MTEETLDKAIDVRNKRRHIQDWIDFIDRRELDWSKSEAIQSLGLANPGFNEVSQAPTVIHEAVEKVIKNLQSAINRLDEELAEM